MQRTIDCFEERGQANTETTLELARERPREAGIGTIVLAGTRGYTAGKALEACTDSDLIAVGIERDSFPAAQFDRFQRTGKLIFSREVGYEYPPEMQRAFRRFGQGTKVAVEVVVCAVQAGLVKVGERVIGMGGSGGVRTRPWSSGLPGISPISKSRRSSASPPRFIGVEQKGSDPVESFALESLTRRSRKQAR